MRYGEKNKKELDRNNEKNVGVVWSHVKKKEKSYI
jgi:hypothetical protein